MNFHLSTLWFFVKPNHRGIIILCHTRHIQNSSVYLYYIKYIILFKHVQPGQYDARICHDLARSPVYKICIFIELHVVRLHNKI